jgi:hypothetical protein
MRSPKQALEPAAKLIGPVIGAVPSRDSRSVKAAATSSKIGLCWLTWIVVPVAAK